VVVGLTVDDVFFCATAVSRLIGTLAHRASPPSVMGAAFLVLPDPRSQKMIAPSHSDRKKGQARIHYSSASQGDWPRVVPSPCCGGPYFTTKQCELGHSALTGAAVDLGVSGACPLKARAMPRNIFISYRREENRYQARMIFNALQKTNTNAFYDFDSIPLGQDFKKIIMDQVQKCDVLLALVGRSWATCLDPKTGLRRVDNADDFVRIEIGTALDRGIPVVPVLLDDASLPETNQLPNDLRSLFDRQAEFVSFRTFDDDVKRLITKLQIESTQKLEPSDLASVQAEQPLGDRVAGYNFMGAISLPSFETHTKIILEWVQRQATIWLSVVKDPKEFIAGTDINSPKALGDSIQFLFFIIVCVTVLGLPLGIFLAREKITIFSLTSYSIGSTVVLLLRVLLFTMAVHISAKVIGGKGSVSRTATSMFYAAAFLPMILLINYGDWAINDPDTKAIAFFVVALPAIAYVVTKLVFLVKFIFSVGTIRALIAVGAGVATVLLPL
jgi:hypothetical protein